MNKVPNLPAPPSAEQRPLQLHPSWRDDRRPLGWLRDPNYPDVQDEDVLAYLKAENAYFEAAMAPHKALTDELFEEMKGRIKEDDSSVPDEGRRLALLVGLQARNAVSRLVSQTCPERSRGPAMARRAADLQRERRGRGQGIFPARRVRGQPRRQAAGDAGRRRRLGAVQAGACATSPTGQDLETVTEVGIGNPVWTSDSKGLVFTEVNDQWRSYRAQYHRIGDDPAKAVTLYRGEGGHRLLGRRGSLDRRQPDLHHHRQQFSRTRSASSPPTTRPRR